jgi:two-component system, OmpR family, phosphate regulon response regulator OmpR
MKDAQHILVVDDDDRLRGLLSQYLSEQGYHVSTAADTQEADAMLKLFAMDAMVLDVMMPGEQGTDYARRLKREGRDTPLLMLTARSEQDDRIEGLEAGAEDYLPKPFAPKELALRLEKLIARTQKHAPRNVMVFGPYRFHLDTGRLMHQDGPVYLTTSEQACLKILAQHAGTPVSREQMAQLIGDVHNERSIDVQINRLRKKIETNPSKPVFIQTIRHAGYVLYTDMR